MESTARSMSRSGQYKWWGLGSWTFVISRTDASRNHGNWLKGTKSSRSPMNSQNPWGETLVTSAREVLGPSAADFIQVLLDQFLCLGDLLRLETEMCHQLQARVDPEFGFAVGVLNVDVSPPFLAGEKVEPEPLDPQNRRTHRASIAQAGRFGAHEGGDQVVREVLVKQHADSRLSRASSSVAIAFSRRTDGNCLRNSSSVSPP